MIESITNALIGGAMIGVASVLMLGLLGRITGISGIVWNALNFNANEKTSAWRWAFLLGLLLGPLLVIQLSYYQLPSTEHGGVVLVVLSGILVGFGTKLGSGCTSGHGVCGIGRLSPRSLVATLIFMASAILTVLIVS